MQPHCFNLDSRIFNQSFNREPFGLTHNLSGLELFEIDSLRRLAERYRDKRDYFLAGGAARPGEKFYSAPTFEERPETIFDKLGHGSYRVLLKRPERYDTRFRDLLDHLFQQVVEVKGGLQGDRLERLELGILVSSASTTTPFHFDPEVAFFSQITGDKIYHVYSPTVLAEEELERFYFRGVVSIGQIELSGRDPVRETVFQLGPGKGLHQPQNSPHWVETGAGLSVSLSFVFETTATRTAGRARAFNFYLRKLGLKPGVLGDRPEMDVVKANAMRTAFGIYLPIRSTVGRVVRYASAH